MKIRSSLKKTILYLMLIAILSGCSPFEQPHLGNEDSASLSAYSNVSSSVDVDAQSDTNMVDERFELLSLIFRLAGTEEYGDTDTEYQRLLASHFADFKTHAAVEYAASLPLGYDAVFKFSVHIEKDGNEFIFLDNIQSLFDDGRWTPKTAQDFLSLLNEFYNDTSFETFYLYNMDFYAEQTQIFVDATYSDIDLDWFSKYINSDNLRCIYTPASSRHNYGATVNDTIVYCAVSGHGGAIVHEFCHSFANEIANKVYDENPEFRKWCDETIDPIRLKSYGNNGKTIAGEYFTRAYNTLYYAQHGSEVLPYLYAERGAGFIYIENVYAMITPYEKPMSAADIIKTICGDDYSMGEEKNAAIANRKINWKFITPSKPMTLEFLQTEVGNLFNSKTGDVIYVEDTREAAPYIMIDLGNDKFQGQNVRKYSRIPLN